MEKKKEKLQKGDRVTIESMYGAPYPGTVASKEKGAQILVKRDDQDYARPYNPLRVNKEKED